MSLTFYLIPATTNDTAIRSMYNYDVGNLIYFVSMSTPTTNLGRTNYVDPTTGQVTNVDGTATSSLTNVYSLAIYPGTPANLFCGNYPAGGPMLYRIFGNNITATLDLTSSGLTNCYVMKFGSTTTYTTLFVGDQLGNFCYLLDATLSTPTVSGTFTVTGLGTLQDMVINNSTIYLSSDTGLYYITWASGTLTYSASKIPVGGATRNIEGLGYNTTNSTLYCILNSAGTRSINTVNLTTGDLTPFTTNLNGQDNIQYIAFDDAGNMYVNDIDSEVSGLYTTNTAVVCFNKGTKILCMNHQLEDEYVAIENLNIGDFVKTFKHGYRKVSKTITGSFVNNPKKWNMCMYKMAKTESNGLLEDLIVTGGHSILVDSLSDAERAKYKEMGIPDFANQTIDKKHLVLSCVSDQFTAMQDTSVYHYYHLLLENNDDEEERFGIWANGVLTETPNVKTIK